MNDATVVLVGERTEGLEQCCLFVVLSNIGSSIIMRLNFYQI